MSNAASEEKPTGHIRAKLSPEKIAEIQRRSAAGESLADVAKAVGVSTATVTRYRRDSEESTKEESKPAPAVDIVDVLAALVSRVEALEAAQGKAPDPRLAELAARLR